MNIILLGLPASGKGTQSQKIIDEFNFVHISTGDIIRDNIKSHTKYGIESKKFVNKGELVPYKLIIEMVISFLDENNEANGFIWDGFPRTVDQAKKLNNLLENRNEKIDIVFHLKIDSELAIKRIASRIICSKCKRSYNSKFLKPNVKGKCDFDNEVLIRRSDDSLKKLENRLKSYELETKPLLDFYKDNLIEIDSSLNDKVVWNNIKEYLIDNNKIRNRD